MLLLPSPPLQERIMDFIIMLISYKSNFVQIRKGLSVNGVKKWRGIIHAMVFVSTGFYARQWDKHADGVPVRTRKMLYVR